jgi:phage-related protein
LITWPSITNPDYPLKETPEDNTIKSTFEDGSVQVRQKFSKCRTTYTLTWNQLKTDEFKKLDSFIKNDAKMGVNTFVWTHPELGTKHTVRVSSYPEHELVEGNYWQVTVELQEA